MIEQKGIVGTPNITMGVERHSRGFNWWASATGSNINETKENFNKSVQIVMEKIKELQG